MNTGSKHGPWEIREGLGMGPDLFRGLTVMLHCRPPLSGTVTPPLSTTSTFPSRVAREYNVMRCHTVNLVM